MWGFYAFFEIFQAASAGRLRLVCVALSRSRISQVLCAPFSGLFVGGTHGGMGKSTNISIAMGECGQDLVNFNDAEWPKNIIFAN